jgi:uncharacterized membrane protein YczE
MSSAMADYGCKIWSVLMAKRWDVHEGLAMAEWSILRRCIVMAEKVMGLEFNFESCSLFNSWVIGRIVDTLIWVFNRGKFLVHNLSL